jgi:leader peptidase (prepilin peptidase)/N-methyltransferase
MVPPPFDHLPFPYNLGNFPVDLRMSVGFLFGLICGSFANVLIFRIPRGENIVTPPSHCPFCGHTLSWYENIPILSWLFLRGRCRECATPIPLRYLLVEVWMGITFAGSAGLLINFWHLGAVWVFLFLLIVLAGIDAEHYILPDKLTYPLLLFSTLSAFLIFQKPLKGFILDVGLGPFLLFSIRTLYQILRKQEGLGLGDVKLMAGIGAFLGAGGALRTILYGSFLGSVVGIALILRKKADLRTALPFGPYLILGAQCDLFLTLTGIYPAIEAGWSEILR